MDGSISNIIVSAIIGIVTGIISSLIVTIYYRKKDNARDKIMFIRQLIRHLSQMTYQLNELFQHTDPRSSSAESLDTIVESILATHRSRPVSESRFRFTSIEKEYIEKYTSLSSTIGKELNEYNRIKNVLVALEHDKRDTDAQEIQQLKYKRHLAAISLGGNVANCYSLRNKIEELQLGNSSAAQKAT